MDIIVYVILTLSALLFIIAYKAFKENFMTLGIVFSLVAIVSTVVSYYISLPETKERYENNMRERKEQIEKDKNPHVIREADGCKVYQFLGDNSKWYYFTRCENSSTVTSSPHTECQLVGKVNTCKDVSTNIETSTTKK